MSNTPDTRSDDTRRNDDQHKGAKSAAQLERELDQARSRLGMTASELSDRLSPSELLDQALDMARKHGGEFGRNLGSQVKSNPIPMILTSVGLSWMMMSSGKNGSTHAHDSQGMGTTRDGHALKSAFGDAAEKSRDKAAAAGDRVQGATASVKESAHNARESLVQFYRDQPLIAGSLGIAIGAALGALVPPTEMEDEVFGEASDQSVDAAKSKAVEEYDDLREMGLAQRGPDANHRQ